MPTVMDGEATGGEDSSAKNKSTAGPQRPGDPACRHELLALQVQTRSQTATPQTPVSPRHPAQMGRAKESKQAAESGDEGR